MGNLRDRIDPRPPNGASSDDPADLVHRIIDATLELCGQPPSEIARRPDLVAGQARRILGEALLLREALGLDPVSVTRARPSTQDSGTRRAR